MLDDLDRELDKRGHRFVRYADDLRVFVRSERAAQRVSGSVCGVIERRLKLKVNRQKSTIRRAAQATLLGFGVLLRRPAGRDPDRPQGDPAAERPAADADPAALKRVDGTPHRQAQPAHHRLDGLLPARLSASDVPLEDISQLVGHASTSVTETVYRHEIRPALTKGAAAMDRIFEKAPDSAYYSSDTS
jgi:hypothetical protein